LNLIFKELTTKKPPLDLAQGGFGLINIFFFLSLTYIRQTKIALFAKEAKKVKCKQKVVCDICICLVHNYYN